MTTTAAAIAHRIDAFVPKSLTAAQWEVAAPAARRLVRAAGPTTAEDAKCLLSSLCTFLAAPSGWDRESEPDFTVLLRDASIAAFKEKFAGYSRTRDNHVGRLRSLQRALVGIARVAGRPHPRRRPASRAVRLAQVVCADRSVATLAAVMGQTTGKALTASRLAGAAIETDRPVQATVTARSTSTVGIDQTVLGAYLHAADSDIQKGVVRATKPTTTRPAKPLSNRRQLANERAERAAARRIQAGPRLAPDPDPTSLDPAVRDAVEQYRPADLSDAEWARLRPLTLRLVVGSRPPSVVSARNVASIVVPFLVWASALPGRPDPASPPDALDLLSQPLVELYAGPGGSWMRRQDVPQETVSTARTVLRRAVRSLDADRQETRFTYVPIDAPYTPAECDELAWLATNQPTVTKERNACFLIGLGLGAGLSATDLRLLRRQHIQEHHGPDGTVYLLVTVPGARARSVPVRRQYEALVIRALELSEDEGPDALVLGKKATRRNVTYVASHGMVTAGEDAAVQIQPHRLRTTWLFAWMNAAIPLGNLLRMAGLRSARSLADLLPLCPPADPAVVDVLVAQVRDAAVGTPSKAARP
ncbi:hypothetical protein H9657_04210 [Cellulomonas sp. Sa3CUA2]|uniref:Tyr recombinase domain-containing protein n=1 Tax=Cellulomonas avistercoris TaxID=2762242 RepID=A0ABR8QAM5_9CELL|nr:hypothetical protein [Cellulomonas avistercoris]MBD7917483.1 hypothetical protein [Cellulomonas avistercoris]